MMLALVALAALVAAAVGVMMVGANGFSARAQPTAAERVVARTARHWAVPQRMWTAANPVPFSAIVWAESRAHFADHCAGCHANDGSGRTEVGQNLYPKAPDMRLSETQSLTDGELYWIIQNGVRLSGMPAWGTGGDGDTDTWKLVHFIRRLKDLTDDQVKEMEGLNPKSPSEFREEQDDQQFLRGDNK
jgi:mono/diheme cytochrome c family protein